MPWLREDSLGLDSLLRGDPESWRRFVIRWNPLIASAARRAIERSGRRVTACDVEDATQEVFVKLVKDDFRVLKQYDPLRASLSTWLTVVARSVTVDMIRRTPAPLTLPSDDHPTPEPAVKPEEPAGAAVDLCVGLSIRQRLVLHLLFDCDMDVPEVARLLGVEEQTVRSTKHKAINKLRSAMAAGTGARGWATMDARTTEGDE